MFGLFFFFQAEDGIRDLTVTGVQTCALPISPLPNTEERVKSNSSMPTINQLVRKGRNKLKRKSKSPRSEEHTSELQSQSNLVCRLLLEKKKKKTYNHTKRSIKAILKSVTV